MIVAWVGDGRRPTCLALPGKGLDLLNQSASFKNAKLFSVSDVRQIQGQLPVALLGSCADCRAVASSNSQLQERGIGRLFKYNRTAVSLTDMLHKRAEPIFKVPQIFKQASSKRHREGAGTLIVQTAPLKGGCTTTQVCIKLPDHLLKFGAGRCCKFLHSCGHGTQDPETSCSSQESLLQSLANLQHMFWQHQTGCDNTVSTP